MENKSKELQIAIQAAKIGAQKALTYFETDLIVESKKDASPVTIADRETEATIKAYISSQIDTPKFVGEETGGDRNESSYWIIDPIDGTRSFTRGIATWCVLIAYYEHDKVRLGVCYFPVFNMLVYAERGKGTFCNEKQVHVSKVGTLENAYIGYGSFKYFTNREGILSLVKKAGSARSFDATYNTVLVVCGKFEASIDAYAQVWDAAPFTVMIDEAGGKLSNLEGQPWSTVGRGCIVTNGLIHNTVVRIVNGKS